MHQLFRCSTDPGRTWTFRSERNPYQLMNGLKLLVDLYFLEIIGK